MSSSPDDAFVAPAWIQSEEKVEEEEMNKVQSVTRAPPPLPKRGMTPIIQKSRADQRQEFEAWQNVWRRIRAAEKNLDLEFELKQMMDYY